MSDRPPREIKQAVYLRLCARALFAGKLKPRPGSDNWLMDLAGDQAGTRCAVPLHLELVALRPGLEPSRRIQTQQRRETRDIIGRLCLVVRCKKCALCTVHKSRHWAGRASVELRRAERTWFVTLTLRPAKLFQLRNECRAIARELSLSLLRRFPAAAREAVRRNDFDKWPQKYQFILLGQQLQREVTRYIKRVRKNSGAKLRYISVVETLNKKGQPHLHVHMLVFEQAGPPVTEHVLRPAWRKYCGQAQAEVAKNSRNAPWYVCKYITKELAHRVRASHHFGITL